MPERVHDWPNTLIRELSRLAHSSFSYGKNDNLLFSANMVQSITGQDFAEEFRGEYDSAKALEEILKKKGKGNLLKTADYLLRPPHGKAIPLSKVYRGDVVYWNKGPLPRGKKGPTLGFCVGIYAVFAVKDGIEYFGIEKMTKVWAIARAVDSD